MYNLRGGFLVRPLTIALALGAAGAFLSWLEETVPAIGAWVPKAIALSGMKSIWSRWWGCLWKPFKR